MTIAIEDIGLDAGEHETSTIEALRRGDADAFRVLVETHHPALRRVAGLYVPNGLVDDVVQETWIGVIRGIDSFEGRSTLKTWLFRILINQARKRGIREARTIPFSAAGWVVGEDRDPVVSRDRLMNPELGPNYWAETPTLWEFDPEDRTLAREVRMLVATAVDSLPPAQREVIVLRDIEGWGSEEVCDTLGISAVNQRVLLHRARAKVRGAIEEYFDAV